MLFDVSNPNKSHECVLLPNVFLLTIKNKLLYVCFLKRNVMSLVKNIYCKRKTVRILKLKLNGKCRKKIPGPLSTITFSLHVEKITCSNVKCTCATL